MAFAENLRAHRTNLDLTQEELANKIGISQKTVSSWEVGRSEPTIKELALLCNIFNCTMAELTGTRDRRTGEINIEDIYAKINTMDIPDLKEIQHVIGARIETLIEFQDIAMEKMRLEKRLHEMEKRLSEMQRKSD